MQEIWNKSRKYWKHSAGGTGVEPLTRIFFPWVPAEYFQRFLLYLSYSWPSKTQEKIISLHCQLQEIHFGMVKLLFMVLYVWAHVCVCVSEIVRMLVYTFSWLHICVLVLVASAVMVYQVNIDTSAEQALMESVHADPPLCALLRLDSLRVKQRKLSTNLKEWIQSEKRRKRIVDPCKTFPKLFPQAIF